MVFERTKEFDRDVKRLLRKYRTLDEDIAVLESVLTVRPNAVPPVFSCRIAGLGLAQNQVVIKLRKLPSDSFRNSGKKSGFRVIYAYFEAEQKIVFIQIYHKSEQANEDRQRILRYFSNT